MLDGFLAADAALFRVLNHSLAHPALDAVMLFLSSQYTWLVVAAVFLVTALLRWNRRYLGIALMVGTAIGVSDLVTYQVLKPTFARSRPCYQLADARLVTPSCGSDNGFPSNHAANSGASTAALALLTKPPVVWIMAGVAFLVGLSRVYLGVHFPGDIAVGWLVGGLIGYVCVRAAKAALSRWRPPPAVLP